MSNNNILLRSTQLFFIFLTAVCTMLICTKSSPLYPMNDWLDANCYKTVGNAMLNGKLPYRDLFEHKGPLIYILHALSAYISFDSFLGMFFIETAACFFFLLLACLTVRRISGKCHLWTVPLTALAVYSSGAFCHGDSAEELCLPLILWGLYCGLGLVTEKRSLARREAFIIGFSAGLVLMTKFNLLGAFAGIILVISVTEIRRKSFRKLIYSAVYCLLGAAVSILPFIVFFAVNGALGSMFEVYFYDNIFIYGDSSSPVWMNIADGYIFLITFLPAGFALIYLGTAFSLFRKKVLLPVYFGTSLLLSFLMIFAGHLSYQYYPLALAAFVPPGIGMLISCFSFNGKAALPAAVTHISSLAACITGCLLLSPNTYLMKYERSDMPQFKFAELINETPEPKLLNYGFLDGGFYLAADTIPEYKYFCLNNTGLEEMIAAQKEYVDSG
ncbi:MAG: hypothetical protein GXY08_13690, partial [Ruminococcus sp.]|nr:hypothetical protein [Ruminococcus sp.]